jgi:glycosyltransferase involved in cell wall biosynthesis
VLTVSIIIPAYNEEKTIVRVLERIASVPVPGVRYEPIVVDDGSSDATAQVVESRPELYSRFIRLPENRGKGAAVRAALAAATGDYVLFQDADLEYDPSDYQKLFLPVQRFDADVVIGSRFMAPEYVRVYYFWHQVGNRLITSLFNILNNTTFTDIYSCYLLYRRSLLAPEELEADGWDQHAEILCRAVSRARVYYEVPISYHGRTYDEGKKIRGKHAIAVLLMILRRRLLA